MSAIFMVCYPHSPFHVALPYNAFLENISEESFHHKSLMAYQFLFYPPMVIEPHEDKLPSLYSNYPIILYNSLILIESFGIFSQVEQVL
jgi:hypothetical protein